MNKKHFLIIALILTAVLVAGCVQAPAIEKQEEADPVEENIEEEVLEEEVPVEQAPQCTTHEDCYDEDECTSDSCKDGVCAHAVESGCEQKKMSEPYISEVNFVGTEDTIEIKAKNYRVDGWTVEDANGTVFITFNDYTTLNNYIILHSASGFSTTVDWYMSKGDFWKEGDTAYLKNVDGEVVSEKTG